MVRRKRPYIPKIKGCYECSQRRINCDGLQPSCQKCTSRGIDCSGFGPKFRFRDGLAGVAAMAVNHPSRRKRTVVASARATPEETQIQEQSPGKRSSAAVRLLLSHRSPSRRPDDPDPSAATHGTAPDADRSRFFAEPHAWCDAAMAERDLWSSSASSSGTSEHEDDNGGLEPESQLSLTPPSPGIDYLSSTKSFLLTYFSAQIAPEMVVIDDSFNGWRHLILPLALSDDLVMDAIMASSAFHLAENVAVFQTRQHTAIAQAGRLYYARAIEGLQRRRQLTDHGAHTRQMVVVALVVLLVAAMVSGCSDFPVVFQMLQSALDAIGGEAGFAEGGTREVVEFSLRQIRKMRVYAAPLLSQDAGLYAILAHADSSFDCLHYYASLYPQHKMLFETLADLRQQAFTIYLRRVLGGGVSHSNGEFMGDGLTGDDLVQHFISTLESLPPCSPGLHALVWACFIAASESRSPEHQMVLVKFLEDQHARNGFANIPRGLELLRQRIWVDDDGEMWPSLLPEPRVFIM